MPTAQKKNTKPAPKTTQPKTEQKETKPVSAKKQAIKADPVVKAEPVVVKEAEVAKVENVVVNVDTTSTINDNFVEFMTKFQSLMTQFNQLKTELKPLEKKTVRELKVLQKSSNKKRKKAVRAPSGFVKPAPISDELAKFLGMPTGSEMARTEVTREINKYIRENSLQDKTNGRKIIPDEKLSVLLKVTDDIDLTYFNLQKYMGPHFPKKTTTEAITSS